MDKKNLLLEVDDLIRTMPERATIRHPTLENTQWFARAAALVERWNLGFGPAFRLNREKARRQDARQASEGIQAILELLHQMRTDLQMDVRGPLSVPVGHGMVFDYFSELRKIVETARTDIFFIDPYLDADVVSQYLAFVAGGVSIRLLARNKLATLMPAWPAGRKSVCPADQDGDRRSHCTRVS